MAVGTASAGGQTLAADYTIDELICTCISRQIEEGEMVAQGISTPLVAAGYLLAKHTHAPNISFASVLGTCMALDAPRLSLAGAESSWIRSARRLVGFSQVVCIILPGMQLKEFFRPAQVDAQGNTNNVAFGSLDRPRFRLPGAGGIPDLTGFSQWVYLYVPRHGRATFVPRLDFRSGVGVARDGGPGNRSGPGPRYLITDLGCFDFAGGRMRIVSRHPGVTVERIQAKTGFPLEMASDAGVPETEPPSREEIRLLREVIDPLGVRTLEVLSGQDRWRKLRRIAAAERSMQQ